MHLRSVSQSVCDHCTCGAWPELALCRVRRVATTVSCLPCHDGCATHCYMCTRGVATTELRQRAHGWVCVAASSAAAPGRVCVKQSRFGSTELQFLFGPERASRSRAPPTHPQAYAGGCPYNLWEGNERSKKRVREL